MESRHNIWQTNHYYPTENDTALGIIKIGLLQAKFCWVLDIIQNFGKFWSLVHSVNQVDFVILQRCTYIICTCIKTMSK